MGDIWKVMLPVLFYFMVFTSLTCENFTELYYNIAEGVVLFTVVSIFVDSLIPPLNKSMYSQPVQAALLPQQPLAHGVAQCLVSGVMASSQIFFFVQRAKQVKI
jgi:hypothetical protein